MKIRRNTVLLVILGLLLTFMLTTGVSASAFGATMLAKGKATASSTVKVKWKQVAGATSYTIYYTPCGKSFSEKNTIKVKRSATSCKVKNLNKSSLYKFYVTANGNTGKIAESLTFHVVLKANKRYTNAKSISIGLSSMTVAKGSTIKAKATVTKEKSGRKYLSKKHDKKIRYLSSDPTIATVGTDGTIKAEKEGSCTVYAIALNGLWAGANVTVTESSGGRDTFSITYKYTGTVPKGAPAAPGKNTYKKGAAVTKAKVPSLTGYTFMGWDGELTTMPGNDVTVTGHWKANEYNITYKYMFGDADSVVGKDNTWKDKPFDDDEEEQEKERNNIPALPDSKKVKYKDTINLPSAKPKMEGYEFVQWYCKEKTMPANNNVVVYGYFVKQCKVTYLVFQGDPRTDYGNNYYQYLGDVEFIHKKVKTFKFGKEMSLFDLYDFVNSNDVNIFYEQRERYSKFATIGGSGYERNWSGFMSPMQFKERTGISLTATVANNVPLSFENLSLEFPDFYSGDYDEEMINQILKQTFPIKNDFVLLGFIWCTQPLA